MNNPLQTELYTSVHSLRVQVDEVLEALESGEPARIVSIMLSAHNIVTRAAADADALVYVADGAPLPKFRAGQTVVCVAENEHRQITDQMRWYTINGYRYQTWRPGDTKKRWSYDITALDSAFAKYQTLESNLRPAPRFDLTDRCRLSLDNPAVSQVPDTEREFEVIGIDWIDDQNGWDYWLRDINDPEFTTYYGQANLIEPVPL